MILFITVVTAGIINHPTPTPQLIVQVPVPAVLSHGGRYDPKLTKENCDRIAEAYKADVVPQLSIMTKVIHTCVPDSQFERDQQANPPF